jgi:hypothetical protein
MTRPTAAGHDQTLGSLQWFPYIRHRHSLRDAAAIPVCSISREAVPAPERTTDDSIRGLSTVAALLTSDASRARHEVTHVPDRLALTARGRRRTVREPRHCELDVAAADLDAGGRARLPSWAGGVGDRGMVVAEPLGHIDQRAMEPAGRTPRHLTVAAASHSRGSADDLDKVAGRDGAVGMAGHLPPPPTFGWNTVRANRAGVAASAGAA